MVTWRWIEVTDVCLLASLYMYFRTPCPSNEAKQNWLYFCWSISQHNTSYHIMSLYAKVFIINPLQIREVKHLVASVHQCVCRYITTDKPNCSTMKKKGWVGVTTRLVCYIIYTETVKEGPRWTQYWLRFHINLQTTVRGPLDPAALSTSSQKVIMK